MVYLHTDPMGSILRAFLSTRQREVLPQSRIDRKTPCPILRIRSVIAHQLASARRRSESSTLLISIPWVFSQARADRLDDALHFDVSFVDHGRQVVSVGDANKPENIFLLSFGNPYPLQRVSNTTNRINSRYASGFTRRLHSISARIFSASLCEISAPWVSNNEGNRYVRSVSHEPGRTRSGREAGRA